MGLGWHVVLQRELPVPAPDPAQGRALIFYQHELDTLARSLNLTSLTAFVSAIPERVAAYLREQGLDPEQFPIDEEDWHPAAEGLASVRGLTAHLKTTPKAVTDPFKILRDLAALEAVLAVAAAANVDFHLASALRSPSA